MTRDRRKTSGIKTPDFLFYFANTKKYIRFARPLCNLDLLKVAYLGQ